MAFQPQNYDFKGQAPQAAIMSAYQNKAKQEYQMKLQAEQQKKNKIQETLGIIQQASNLVQQGVTMSTNRQKKEAKESFAALMTQQATEGKFGPTPGYQDRLKTAGQRAFPEMSAKLAMEDLYSDKTPTAKDIAQTDKYTAEAEFLRGGRSVAPKTKSDVALMEQAAKQSLSEMKAENPYGGLGDENFALNVKKRTDTIYKELKEIQGVKAKAGHVKVMDPNGVVANIPISDWNKRKAKYTSSGYKRVK